MSTPDELVPRQYQEEIFVQAQEGNIIAALGTGSGKTFISILLIKWIATLDVSRGKAIIFLVPKVPLVEQQGEFIAKHTTLRVIKLHGASAHELTDRVSWGKVFSKNDVFVMTAQIFLNLITHSLWTIDKVSLLVFDECHHARKNHPYNGIMREYMLLAVENRPKIFGLTASPIQNAKNPISSLNELQTNMNARVIGVLDNVAELAKHSPKPVEVITEYPLPPEQYLYPRPSLYDCLNAFDPSTLPVFTSSWADIERRYHATIANLGPYCASLYVFLEMKRLILSLGHLEAQKDVDDDMIIPCITADQEKVPEEILYIADIVSQYECFFSSDDDVSIPIVVPMDWFAPKVKVLVEVLVAHYSMTDFQGIIFVEQRQVAVCLAKVLPRVQVLEGLVRCGEVVGNNSDARIMGSRSHSETVKLFREGALNLLIATSVAEEGLDFPACDLVIRFDPLQHMVGYVQSRGRARNKISKFIIMLPAGDYVSLARYHAFTSAESNLTNLYTSLALTEPTSAGELEDLDDEPIDPEDLAERERFVVPTTGAFVNYDNAISLIGHLCSLIPHDVYTPPHRPVYTGDFQVTLDLPKSLPLSANDLSYEGPMKRSKKEAKRAAAFVAARRLYELEVFDDYLLPVSSNDAKEAGLGEKGDIGVKTLPIILDVLVKDPWRIRNAEKLWIHPVHHDGVLLAGLVTGTCLYPTSVRCPNGRFGIGRGRLMTFCDALINKDETQCRRMMEEYTKQSLFLLVTTANLSGLPSAYLIPVTADLTPNYEVMERLVLFPKGHQDWSSITEEHYEQLLVGNSNQHGRPLLLHRIRADLTPLSSPSPGTPEAASPTYHEYYTGRWTRKKRKQITWRPCVPTEGPMIEVSRRVLSTSGVYGPDGYDTNSKESRKRKEKIPKVQIIPQGCCSWFDIPPAMALAYQAFPVLCQRLTDVYRARETRWLGLPTIREDLLIQALTIPSVGASFNNQRLETLGDAVLELCTSVHFFNKFPHKHEGQLTSLRQQFINNRFLCGRALRVGLEGYITSEGQKQNRIWRYVEGGDEGEGRRRQCHRVRRSYPRRSLQDSMEAILGAAFETGGIPMALHAGVALDLAFGGHLPWGQRYEPVLQSPVSQLFTGLEEKLGYKFRNGQLLKEAVTHPSFSSFADTGTYQRLEFLGDAILDLVVIHYLYRKFPNATSHQLAFPRTKAVCAPALASLAVRCLGIQRLMLANNVALSVATSEYVPHLERASAEIIVRDGWRFDPPKALSDVFESIIGAVLIDSGYDYEKTAVIVETLMSEILELLSPSLCRDPVTILTEWLGSIRCLQKVKFSRGSRDGREGTEVRLHGVLIAGPIVSNSSSVAKNLAAERAFSILQDGNDQRSLLKICDCHLHRPVEVAEQPTQGIQECC
ncbi:hypothetical protein L218DRAFT_120083 [Marasmius fiardii PR-910]|nr:hypothetical protein L218DRAFT_120083 [Marasmius fiardii PR-910]